MRLLAVAAARGFLARRGCPGTNAVNPTSPAAASLVPAVLLIVACRGIVTSHDTQAPYNNRTLERSVQSRKLGIQVHSRTAGKAYQQRDNARLWPSLERLEEDLTTAAIAPAERLPPFLLPPALRTLQLERAGGRDIDPKLLPVASMARRARPVAIAEAEEPNGVTDAVDALQLVLEGAPPSESISSSNPPQVVDADTATSLLQLEAAHTTQLIDDEFAVNGADPAEAWAALGLDPLVAALTAAHVKSPTATRGQSRLLRLLLNADHDDVIAASVTGSGKTVALLAALLNGARTEDTGLNVFVAASSALAYRAYVLAKGLVSQAVPGVNGGHPVGGALVDSAEADLEWMYLAQFREDHVRHFNRLARDDDDGATQQDRSTQLPAVRVLFTTADVLCEMLFESKLQFKELGYLRRLYVDDAGPQFDVLDLASTMQERKARLREPRPVELLLGSVHQHMAPQPRSLLQIACVSAELESFAKDHILSLCMKPERHAVALSPNRLPSTLHCLFAFPAVNEMKNRLDPRVVPFTSSPSSHQVSTGDDQPSSQAVAYAALLSILRTTAAHIPGRALIFVPRGDDLVAARARLRRMGLDVRMLHEILQLSPKGEATCRSDLAWKFVLCHEDQGYGLDIPLLSHVFITFPPSSRYAFMHMAGRAARGGAPGWAYVICERGNAKHVADVVGELDVDVTRHTVDPWAALSGPIDALTVTSWVKPPTPWPLDPQYAVKQRYDWMESGTFPDTELWRPQRPERDFILENYEPLNVQMIRFRNAQRLQHDIQKSPGAVLKMAQKQLLTAHMRPTRKLRAMLEERGESHYPYDQHTRGGSGNAAGNPNAELADRRVPDAEYGWRRRRAMYQAAWTPLVHSS